MKKIELLSPCGNIESLYQAVHNGADAVYLGGKKFGARAYAGNFDNEEMIEAIKYCHLYGLKIYVTVNTLIYEEEFEEVLHYVEFLYENNVDAIIMQDLGLIATCRRMFPNLEIHASTQFHNHNREGLKLLKSLGVTRAVLARELSLTEIKELNVEIEKEVFVHGALCISYSGCCLMSSMNGNRSGNRGECTGSCRMPYELYCQDEKIETDGTYLLSTRELNTSGHIKELIESGITSFKIEGRMKSPEYVGFVTRLYRTLIDKYYKKEDLTVSDAEITALKKLYNRRFTEGFLFSSRLENLMNIQTPNHIGVEIGSVIAVDTKKIKILLTEDLNQEDGIRFGNSKGMTVNKLYNEKGLLVNGLSRGSIAILDNKIGLDEKLPVLKTIDYKLIRELREYQRKRIPIRLRCLANIGEKLTIIMDDGTHSIKVEGQIVEPAIHAPLTKERLQEQLMKLNDTPFIVKEMDIILSENSFVVIREINELRRRAVNELIRIRENEKKEIIINREPEIAKQTHDLEVRLSVLARTEEQLRCLIDEKVDSIYITDYELYLKYKNQTNIYYKVPRIRKEFQEFNHEKLLISELGGVFQYAKNNKTIGDYFLNVTNSRSIEYLINKLGLDRATLSVECSSETIKNIALFNQNIEVIVYGRIELMVMKYCPLKLLVNKEKSNCRVCKTNKEYYLKDQYQKLYPIVNDNEITYIMHNKNINKCEYIKEYLTMNIRNFRVELFRENYEETKTIVQSVMRGING